MRLNDWPERLSRVFEQAQGKAFQWGAHDCALFVCDGIRAVLGVDVGKPFRGKYRTRLRAYTLIRQFCGGGLEQLAEKIASERGFRSIPVQMAQRGDVVLHDAKEGPALGIVCLDGKTAGFASGNGLSRVPLSLCRRAWRIE